jgi:hypothetical protein
MPDTGTDNGTHAQYRIPQEVEELAGYRCKKATMWSFCYHYSKLVLQKTNYAGRIAAMSHNYQWTVDG